MVVCAGNVCNTESSFHMHRQSFDMASDLTATYVGECALRVQWSQIESSSVNLLSERVMHIDSYSRDRPHLAHDQLHMESVAWSHVVRSGRPGARVGYDRDRDPGVLIR